MILLAPLCAIAQAEPDFFGVKMKSQDFAQNIVIRENRNTPDFSNNRPGTDKRIYAYGYTSSWIGGSKGISVRVFNHADKAIRTEKVFRDMILFTRDGRRFERSEPEMMFARDTLEPGEEATFNFKFPGIRVAKDEVELIVCSFDLGQTSIYLFPMKEKPEANVDQSDRPGFWEAMKLWFGGAPKKKAPNEPKKTAQEAAVEDREVPKFPLIKAEQVIDGVKYEFRPNYRSDVQASQTVVDQKVFRVRPWSLDDPDKYLAHQESYEFPRGGLPRRVAQVAVVNDDYGFVVVNAGYNDGFDKNVILDVLRNGRKIGKVMITKPRDNVAGAMILREWATKDAIRVGDLVGISD